MELKNKVALVTGGSSGIGAETVKILSKNGCKVVVGYHSGEKRAKNLIKKLYNNGHSIVKIDLRDQILITSFRPLSRAASAFLST